jgi:hypothetical protein
MKRALVLVALAVMALVPTPVAAAPAAPAAQCVPDATTQHDMAGVYRAGALYVEIFPCGGIYVEWANASGTHAAGYITEAHASDGVIATLHRGDGLDGQPILVVKAAERGFVQVATADNALNIVQVYRLRKTS